MLTNMIYDRTATDVAQKTAKGRYQAADMNRVRTAVLAVYARFLADGYNVTTPTLGTWAENEIPRVNKATVYLNAVRTLRGIIAMPDSYAIPTTMNGLDYNGANEIERFLYDSDLMIDNLESAWWFCDEIYSDEVDM